MTTCNDETIIPGSWECPQCGFILNKSDLRIEGKTGGQNNEECVDRCPNDGQMLKPETWKSRSEKLAAACEQLLTEIDWLNDFCTFKPN